MTDSPKRKKLTRDQREAACLLRIRKGDQWLIPEPLRSSGDAKAIIAFVQYDHGVPHAFTADDRPQNLEPMRKADHAAKTAKLDVPRIAKAKRIAKAEAEFRRRVLAKSDPDQTITESDTKKRKWPSRPLRNPKGVKYQWGKRRAKERGEEGSRGEGPRGARDQTDT